VGNCYGVGSTTGTCAYCFLYPSSGCNSLRKFGRNGMQRDLSGKDVTRAGRDVS
jgi:hypothetical protein